MNKIDKRGLWCKNAAKPYWNENPVNKRIAARHLPYLTESLKLYKLY
jgi:hypothetical protein